MVLYIGTKPLLLFLMLALWTNTTLKPISLLKYCYFLSKYNNINY